MNGLVIGETDINLMNTDSKLSHEHQASLISDGSFTHNNHYMQSFGDSDVESVPIYNSNVSIGNRSGKLYNYDDYLASIDMYPGYDQNGYDYGEQKFDIFF